MSPDERPNASLYTVRRVPRMECEEATYRNRTVCEHNAVRQRLNAAWREQGGQRPLLLSIGESVWVLECAERASQLFAQGESWPSAWLYRVNQATGQWTTRQGHPLRHTTDFEVLPLSDPRVQKARAWVVARKLNGDS